MVVAMIALLATSSAQGAGSVDATATAVPEIAAVSPAWRSADAWLRVAGRLHPMLVHFPIALILAAALIELLRAGFRRGPSRTAVTMLCLGVLGAAAAIGTGWLNGAFEPRSGIGTAIELHRWFAVAGGSVALLAAPFGAIALRRTTSRRMTIVFRATLLVAAGVTGFAAHLGGRMVYGAGYLLAPLSMSRTAPSGSDGTAIAAAVERDARATTKASRATDGVDRRETAVHAPAADARLASARAFDAEVRPILELHCVECHGSGRARASLRLDKLEHVLGAEPWVLALDAPPTSDLVARVKRSEDEEGAMPPTGPRLTTEEIATIERWIASHAAAEQRETAGTSTGGSADPVRPSRSSPSGTAGAAVDASAAESADASGGLTADQVEAITFLRSRGASIEPIAAGSELLDVNLSLMAPPCDAVAIARLAPLLPLTQRLDLAGADVGNEIATLLARLDMQALPLRFLDLHRTRIDDGAADALAALPALETLIVTNTGLSDAGVSTLVGSGALRTIYAAGSKVTEAGAATPGAASDAPPTPAAGASPGAAPHRTPRVGPRVVLGAPPRQTVVHLVRHAEKGDEGDDPSLTEAGAARAGSLVAELAGEPIRAIFVTPFARTRETAAPIAKALGLTPTVIEVGGDLDDHVRRVVDAIRALPRGSMALVVGHSNTVPAIMRALGVVETITIDEDEYGDLFTLRLDEGAAKMLRQGRFGGGA